MAQDLRRYFQTVQERDFLRDHQFRVSSLMYRGQAMLTEKELVYIKSASLPGRSVNSVAVPFMGLNFKVPGTAQYTDQYQLTFYCDSPGIIRNIWEAFSFAVFDDRKSFGNYNVQANDVLSFYQYDQRGVEAVTNEYTLIGIFPTNIGDIDHAPTGNGDTRQLSVTLAYQFWRKNKHLPVAQNTPIPPVAGGAFPVGGV